MGFAEIIALLGTLLGGEAAGDKLDNAKLKSQKAPKQLGKAKLALLAQMFPEKMAAFQINKKQAKAEGLGKFETAKIGNQLYRVPGSEEFDELVGTIEDKQFEKIEDTRLKLLEQPLFRSIFKEAAGDFSDVEALVGDAFGDLAQRSVGGAAAKGTLSTPGAVNRALGPLALEKARFLKGLQDTATQRAISATTAGPGTASNIFAAPTLAGMGSFMNNIFGQNQAIGQHNAGITGLQAGITQGQGNAGGAGLGSLFG